ncbi:lysylphosphatidylglycerol synthase transmembrane domain-containing protein [Mesonia sp. K7]|uniref:lysylphosphatidylglycerol synthase transmembrane domain-containing protein n=1 Tax=Mesonia sp. K7 TaxID=2218606 RepID=UPI000DA7AE36|nr:lysylphosphatidylglycerol synthase transmembrane domain-containing protein [Mesonia sp. K7]PZD78981.1 TIGR00374 family protein [Mesonia sp. K7]
MNKKKIIKLLKVVLPILLGVFFIYLSFSSSTPQEREELWQNILNAKPFFIGLSLLCGFLSHLSRAYRWKYLLEPLGYQIKFRNSFMAVMSAYLANLGIPRSGEVLRAATITTYENIPFEKNFGTIISERMIDLVMLLLIVGITLLWQTETLLQVFETYQINPLFTFGALIILIALGVLFLKLIKNSTHPLLQKIKKLGSGILKGIKSVLKLKHKVAFFLHTIFIWTMYITMFFLIKFAVPGAEEIPFAAIMVAFVVGSFAISITNGGIGVYPVAIGAVLLLYGIPKQTGEAFGWVIWGSQTLLNIVLGGLSMLLLPILNRKK